jgi:hypothetical protein
MKGWACSSQLLLAQSFSGSTPAELVTTFYSLKFETHPTWGARSPVFISPRNRVAQLNPQALGSFFVASYDSQGYGGGIRPLNYSSRVSSLIVTTE